MIHTILHSALLLAATLVFFWLFGFVFLQAICRHHDFEEKFVLSPLIGIAIALAIAGHLWCLNIKMQYSIYVLLGLFLLLTLLSLSKKKFSLINITEQINKNHLGLFLIAVLIISLIQGISYFILGPSLYIGFGTRDMWNYTAIAQTIIDLPYSISLQNGNQNPLLPIFDYLKDSRPGSSIIQAIISIFSRHSTKDVWGAISLLGPILMTCSLWLIGRELGIRPFYRFLSTLIGASLPGIAWIHLENTFLGHALSLPFIIIWPYLIQRLLKKTNAENFIIATAIFFTVSFVYTEIITLLIISAALMVGWDVIQSYSIHSFKMYILKLFSVTSTVMVGLLMIPTDKMKTLQLLYTSPFFQMSPWPIDGLTLSGLVRIWSPNLNWLTNETLIFLVTLFTLLSILLCWSGIFLAFFQKRTLLSLGLITFLCVPILLLSYPGQHIYQYYKTLITFSPILPLGLVFICQNLIFGNNRETHVIKIALISIGIILFIMAAFGTYLSGKALLAGERQFRDPGFIKLTQEIRHLKNKNILIIEDDYFFGEWLAYYGRQNQLWFTRDHYDAADWTISKNGKHMGYSNLSFLSISPFEIIQRVTLFTPETAQLQKNVAIIAENISIKERDMKKIVLTKKVLLNIISRKDCKIRLSFLASPQQPSHQPLPKIYIRNNTTHWETRGLQHPTKINYTVSLRKGENRISITPSSAMILSDLHYSE